MHQWNMVLLKIERVYGVNCSQHTEIDLERDLERQRLHFIGGLFVGN